MFFSCMSLALLGVKYKGDKRDRYLHHGHPLAKLGLWLLFTALPFLFPNEVLDAYSEYQSSPSRMAAWTMLRTSCRKPCGFVGADADLLHAHAAMMAWGVAWPHARAHACCMHFSSACRSCWGAPWPPCVNGARPTARPMLHMRLHTLLQLLQ